jgi:hypothetical protein
MTDPPRARPDADDEPDYGEELEDPDFDWDRLAEESQVSDDEDDDDAEEQDALLGFLDRKRMIEQVIINHFKFIIYHFKSG